VTWAIEEKSYSQRRACALVGLHPRTYRYASTRPDDTALRAKLRDLASQRRRFGYRRLGLMLERQGIKLNAKKLYRLYKEERLTVRKRGGRKRALGTRAPMTIPQDRNLRWSLEFVAESRFCNSSSAVQRHATARSARPHPPRSSDSSTLALPPLAALAGDVGDRGLRWVDDALDNRRQCLERVTLLITVGVPVIRSAHAAQCMTETHFGDIGGDPGAGKQSSGRSSQIIGE
jgi:hypothetical protein